MFARSFLFSSAIVLSALASSAHAGLYIVDPVASSVYSGGKPFTIKWEVDPDHSAPAGRAFGAVKAGLWTGSTTNQVLVQDLGTVANPTRVPSLTVTIKPSVGPNSDQYFVRLDSISGKDAKGSALQSFSSRFTLKSMTGKFTAAQQQALKGVAAAKATTKIASATASTSLGGASSRASAGASRNASSNSNSGVPLIAQVVANATGTTVNTDANTNTNTNTTKFSNTTSASASASAKAESGSELRFVLSGGVSGLVMGGVVAILTLSTLF